MISTNSSAGANGSSLTVEALLEAYQELEALLPELIYMTHEYVSRTKNGEPFFAAIPEFDWQSGDTTDRYVLFLHPDNLALLRLKTKGMFRLVEWQPERRGP